MVPPDAVTVLLLITASHVRMRLFYVHTLAAKQVTLRNDLPRPLRVSLSYKNDKEPNTVVPVNAEICLPFPVLHGRVSLAQGSSCCRPLKKTGI